jgi:hypothetical protein
MSVESSHLVKHSDIGGWSDNISHRTYQKLVDFFKQRQPIHIEGSEICMYNKNVATRSPETCWDEDSMKEHVNHLEEHGKGWWLHLDKEIENVKPSTFRVRNRESLFLLDLRFVGRHDEIWQKIVAIVNEVPDIFGPGVEQSDKGSGRHEQIEQLMNEMKSTSTGKSALLKELAELNIYSNLIDHKWFWKAMRDVGADGYVTYDYQEARNVDVLSPKLLRRTFLPPIADQFGKYHDAIQLASKKKSTGRHLSKNTCAKSVITFPQIVLIAKGAQKLEWIDPLPKSNYRCASKKSHRDKFRALESRSTDEQSENQDQVPGKGSQCTIS